MKPLWGDYLLGDLDAAQKALVEKHLQVCATCQQEFKEFQETLTLLKQWPDADPAHRLVFVADGGQAVRSIHKKRNFFLGNWRQPIRWAAAFGTVLLLALGLFRTEFSYKDGHVQFAFGHIQTQSSPAAADWVPILKRFRQETAATVARLLQASEVRQQKNLVWAVEKLNQQWSRQRQDDLRLIAAGFQVLKAENENRALETNRFIQWLVQQGSNTLPVQSQKLERRK
jgi:hypothetical protein